MKIDKVEIALLQYLFDDGWALKLEEDIAEDFRCFCAFKKDGPLNGFTRVDVILFTLDNNPDDVAVRFLFQADPEREDLTAWSYGKKAQENTCEALRRTCESLLNKSGMNTEKRLVTIGTKSSENIGVENATPLRINSAHHVELVYWQQQ